MSVLVDTCVWSYALRRKNQPEGPAIINTLDTLIQQRQVVIIGAIRQEILSGIAHEHQFERILEKLRAFPDHPIPTAVFETATQLPQPRHPRLKHRLSAVRNGALA